MTFQEYKNKLVENSKKDSVKKQNVQKTNNDEVNSDTVTKHFMTSDDFLKRVREIVFDYTKEHLEKTDDTVFTIDDVYIVMYSFILGNQKAIVSTTLPDGMYYELTYNAATGEIYFDGYKKWENRCIET